LFCCRGFDAGNLSATVASSIASSNLRQDLSASTVRFSWRRRSEDFLELAERHDDERILRLGEKRTALLADADDLEMNAFDLNGLPDSHRFVPNDDRDVQPTTMAWPRRSIRSRASADRARVEGREIHELRRHTLHADAVDGLGRGNHLALPRESSITSRRRLKRRIARASLIVRRGVVANGVEIVVVEGDGKLADRDESAPAD